METIKNILYAIAALVGAIFAIDFLRGRHTSKEVEKFNKERAEALALDKQVEQLKTEVVRDTLTYEEKLRAHRAKFGSAKQPGPGDSNR